METLDIRQAVTLFSIIGTMKNTYRLLGAGSQKSDVAKMHDYCCDILNPWLEEGSFSKISEIDSSGFGNDESHMSHDTIGENLTV